MTRFHVKWFQLYASSSITIAIVNAKHVRESSDELQEVVWISVDLLLQFFSSQDCNKAACFSCLLTPRHRLIIYPQKSIARPYDEAGIVDSIAAKIVQQDSNSSMPDPPLCMTWVTGWPAQGASHQAQWVRRQAAQVTHSALACTGLQARNAII